MKNKKNLKDGYASEDYPKEINEKRKLQVKLIEERKIGNYTIINYDKLIIKEGTSNLEIPIRVSKKYSEFSESINQEWDRYYNDKKTKVHYKYSSPKSRSILFQASESNSNFKYAKKDKDEL